MSKIHQYWKMVVIGFAMLYLIAVGNAARIFLRGEDLRAFQTRLLRRIVHVGLGVLGVKVEIANAELWRNDQNYLMVSNHLSYLDIMVYASYKPMCFVSTVEVEKTPVLGHLAKASGCIFVERRSRENIRQEVEAIAGALRAGHNMIFFPEGTSTNGTSVLPFKKPLFAPAQQAGVSVLPAVIQVREINGQPVTSANRDLICWYGDMDFTPHLLAMAALRSIRVTVTLLPPFPVSEATPRDEIAKRAHDAIANVYQPIA